MAPAFILGPQREYDPQNDPTFAGMMPQVQQTTSGWGNWQPVRYSPMGVPYGPDAKIAPNGEPMYPHGSGPPQTEQGRAALAAQLQQQHRIPEPASVQRPWGVAPNEPAYMADIRAKQQALTATPKWQIPGTAEYSNWYPRDKYGEIANPQAMNQGAANMGSYVPSGGSRRPDQPQPEYRDPSVYQNYNAQLDAAAQAAPGLRGRPHVFPGNMANGHAMEPLTWYPPLNQSYYTNYNNQLNAAAAASPGLRGEPNMWPAGGGSGGQPIKVGRPDPPQPEYRDPAIWQQYNSQLDAAAQASPGLRGRPNVFPGGMSGGGTAGQTTGGYGMNQQGGGYPPALQQGNWWQSLMGGMPQSGTYQSGSSSSQVRRQVMPRQTFVNYRTQQYQF